MTVNTHDQITNTQRLPYVGGNRHGQWSDVPIDILERNGYAKRSVIVAGASEQRQVLVMAPSSWTAEQIIGAMFGSP